MNFRRELIPFSLAVWIIPNGHNQSLAFMVGHSQSLHLEKLQYSTKPSIENINTKRTFDVEVDPLLSLHKEMLNDDGLETVTPKSDTAQDIITSSPKMNIKSGQEPRPFPFSLIVDQQEIKHALLLAAVNPNSVGVLISGGRGTAKSVLARSMEKIVPQVCCVYANCLLQQ